MDDNSPLRCPDCGDLLSRCMCDTFTENDMFEEYPEDEYFEDGKHVDTCTWCGSAACGCITKKIIP